MLIGIFTKGAFAVQTVAHTERWGKSDGAPLPKEDVGLVTMWTWMAPHEAARSTRDDFDVRRPALHHTRHSGTRQKF